MTHTVPYVYKAYTAVYHTAPTGLYTYDTYYYVYHTFLFLSRPHNFFISTQNYRFLFFEFVHKHSSSCVISSMGTAVGTFEAPSLPKSNGCKFSSVAYANVWNGTQFRRAMHDSWSVHTPSDIVRCSLPISLYNAYSTRGLATPRRLSPPDPNCAIAMASHYKSRRWVQLRL